MQEFIRSLLLRHETVVDPRSNIKGGIGAMLGMLAVGELAVLTGQPLMIAPLGATVVLLFGQPSSPLAQPINVMLGYLIGAICCEAAFFLLPGDWQAAALAVGATVVAMRLLRVTHPPAGAIPIMGFGQQLHGMKLFGIVLVACLILIAIALVIHRIPPVREYPRKAD